MNLKPTLIKPIVSVVLFFAVNLFLASQVICTDSCPPWYSFAFDRNIIFIGLVVAIVVYIIWSLFEKKK